MTSDPSVFQSQLFRLASDNSGIYQDAWRWLLDQGASIAPDLVAALGNEALGSVAHWRILLILREFAVPSTFPAIREALRRAIEHRNPIVIPGAIEAVAVFPEADAVPALEFVVRNGQIDDVQHAAMMLGKLGGSGAVALLGELLNHPQAPARKSAVLALLTVNTSAARDLLKAHRDKEEDAEIRALIMP